MILKTQTHCIHPHTKDKSGTLYCILEKDANWGDALAHADSFFAVIICHGNKIIHVFDIFRIVYH